MELEAELNRLRGLEAELRRLKGLELKLKELEEDNNHLQNQLGRYEYIIG